MDLIRSELRIIREKYADERRTRFVEATGELSIEDLIAPEDQVITLSVNGYIKRSSPSEYAAQRRGGKGRKGARPRAEDSVKEIFLANTHSKLLIFTRQGQIFRVPVYQVPKAGLAARGLPVVNLVQLSSEDEVAAVLSIKDFDEPIDLIFCSRKVSSSEPHCGGIKTSIAVVCGLTIARRAMNYSQWFVRHTVKTTLTPPRWRMAKTRFSFSREMGNVFDSIGTLRRSKKAITKANINSVYDKWAEWLVAFVESSFADGDEIACMEVLDQDPELRFSPLRKMAWVNGHRCLNTASRIEVGWASLTSMCP